MSQRRLQASPPVSVSARSPARSIAATDDDPEIQSRYCGCGSPPALAQARQTGPSRQAEPCPNSACPAYRECATACSCPNQTGRAPPVIRHAPAPARCRAEPRANRCGSDNPCRDRLPEGSFQQALPVGGRNGERLQFVVRGDATAHRCHLAASNRFAAERKIKGKRHRFGPNAIDGDRDVEHVLERRRLEVVATGRHTRKTERLAFPLEADVEAPRPQKLDLGCLHEAKEVGE